MKNYLDLVPISQKLHRRQSRMIRLCIVLSVFLVTAIFGMADMEIRSQNAQAKINYGEWHAGFGFMSDDEASLIAQRPKVLASTRYDTLNYRLNMQYQVEGKESVIVGFDESAMDIFPTARLIEGSFPEEEGGVIIDENMKQRLSLNLGDKVTLFVPDGSQKVYRVTGVFGQFPMLAKADVFGIALSTEDFRKLSLEEADGNYDSYLYVKFSPWCNIQKEIREIQNQFQIPDERVGRNEMLLATIGQSRDISMMAIYAVAFLLAILVSAAGILMITGSLNSSIAQRTEFFGMLRCLGASREQVSKFVSREALYWCKTAVPAGGLLGMVVVWVLSALLRFLSPMYFGSLPYFGVSLVGLFAGSVIGVTTVFLASQSPAKKAAKVSPLTAVSGNASVKSQVKRAANTRLYRIETALGIHHALGSRKNFLLMSGSFAFSIILFLVFSVAVDFMEHAVTPLDPSTPDVSLISADNICAIDKGLVREIEELDGAKRVYGRSFAYDVPIQTSMGDRKACLISYDACQFTWAGKSLLGKAGTGRQDILRKVADGEGILAVYHGEDSLTAGESVTMDSGEGGRRLTISGVLSKCPFHASDGEEILICSEETFLELTGEDAYTVIDVQLTRKAGDDVAQKIRAIGANALGEKNMSFSDRRLSNGEVRGAVWSFKLFVYGFLGVIALICTFHIRNSIAMSVSARLRQYGAMRAVGMDSAQMLRMVAAEAVTYGGFGMLAGCMAGLPLNRLCFEKLVTLKWGTAWYFPVMPLSVILLVMLCSLTFAVYSPAKRIREMSVVDTISGR